ncbi:hypothetical protein PR048_008671 [Dryococelus australis]|uniref:Uncharacterized protein n=1 Tax=Dryococelus australis TaxID=614101 RepID=A0ABQ9HY31_9NEOP|nr:hypothetical protein PR048_008671 [Dryococelus australis]
MQERNENAHCVYEIPRLTWRMNFSNAPTVTLVGLLASHLGLPGSISGGVTPGFSHVGIVPYNVADRLVFSAISRYPLPFIPTLLQVCLASPSQGSQDLDRSSSTSPGYNLVFSACRRALASYTFPPLHLSSHRITTPRVAIPAHRHDRNTARLACRSGEALEERVSVARIAPSLLDLGRAVVRRFTSQQGEPGSIHGEVASGFSYVGVVQDLPSPLPFYSGAAPYPHRCILIGSQDLDNPGPPAPQASSAPTHRATVRQHGGSEMCNFLQLFDMNSVCQYHGEPKTFNWLQEKRRTQVQRIPKNHESCRWSADFIRDLSFAPTLHSCAASYSPRFTLIGSQDGMETRSVVRNGPHYERLPPNRRSQGECRLPARAYSLSLGNSPLRVFKGSAWLHYFSPFLAEKRYSYKGYTGPHYMSAIAATRRALNWNKVLFDDSTLDHAVTRLRQHAAAPACRNAGRCRLQQAVLSPPTAPGETAISTQWAGEPYMSYESLRVTRSYRLLAVKGIHHRC